MSRGSSRSRGSFGKSRFHAACGKYDEDLHPPQPVIDESGEFAYPPKYKKPKWVLRSEYERFNKFENHDLSHENSRNNRLKVNNPFTNDQKLTP